MATCRYCGKSSLCISQTLGFCLDCIRDHYDAVRPHLEKLHAHSRRRFNLPVQPPRAAGGVACPLCMHACRIGEGERGYCGLRRVTRGRLIGGNPEGGNLRWYHDPLPTNCVADFVCPAGTGCGYPKYAHTQGPETGFKNLAVFYRSCSFNCLYCQNHSFKQASASDSVLTAVELAQAVGDETACICFFGGDPTSQVSHALQAARVAVKRKHGDILRILLGNQRLSPRTLSHGNGGHVPAIRRLHQV